MRSASRTFAFHRLSAFHLLQVWEILGIDGTQLQIDETRLQNSMEPGFKNQLDPVEFKQPTSHAVE